MANRASSRRKPRQTQLSFMPLASSSPAATSLSPQVRDRAAKVTYSGSPSPAKRRRVAALMSETEEDITPTKLNPLPTPEKSFRTLSTMKTPSGREGTHPGSPVGRSRNGMFRQSDKLNDLVELSSSDDSSGTASSTVGRAGKPMQKPTARSQKQALTPEDDTVPSRVLRPNLRSNGRVKVTEASAISTSCKAPRPRRGATLQQSVAISSNDNSDSEDESPIPAKSSRSFRANSTKFQIIESEPSSSDDMPTSSPMKKPRKSRTQNARKRSPSFEVPDNVFEDEDEDEAEKEVCPTPRRLIRRHNRNRSAYEDDSNDSDESDSEVLPPLRARNGHTPDQRQIRKEKEDLEEDLEFLQSSPVGRLEKARPRTSAKQNAHQKALDILKRRRAGEKIDSSESEVSRHGSSDVYRTESENEVIDVDDDEVEDYTEEDVAPSGYRHADALDMFQEDDHDAGFVVEDEEGTDVLGAPAQMPLQFSSLSRSKGRDLFKYAIEWMVQKKLNPAFEMNDEIYGLTFQKLDDEVRGLAGSKFTSSAWTPDFTRALKSRPDMGLEEIPKDVRAIMEPHCEACNRRSHPATWSLQFTGKPYHRESLEPVSDESDSDDSSAGDGKTYNSEGQAIPDENRQFTVGKYCMHNAQMSHTLTHWRYHLNSWVVDYLLQKGYCSAEKIVERDSWSIKKRRKYADKIVDQMEEQGEIYRLYKDYKLQIDAAVEEKQQTWGRNGDMRDFIVD